MSCYAVYTRKNAYGARALSENYFSVKMDNVHQLT